METSVERHYVKYEIIWSEKEPPFAQQKVSFTIKVPEDEEVEVAKKICKMANVEPEEIIYPYQYYYDVVAIKVRNEEEAKKVYNAYLDSNEWW